MGSHLDATLSLLDKYMSERYGGLDSHIAADFTRDVLQKSQPTNLRKIFSTQSTVTASMRWVLIRTKNENDKRIHNRSHVNKSIHNGV